jgi:hypothetical protein
MLCEDDWEARSEQENSVGSGSGARGRQRGRGHGRGRAGTSSRDGRDGQSAQAAKPGGKKPPPGYHCQSYGKTGHWTNECCSKKGAAHVAQAKEEEHALMYIAADPEVIASPVPCCPRRPPLAPAAPESKTRVHLTEPKVLLHLSEEQEEAVQPHRWVLDTGATNHMTGARSVFAELDTSISGTVKFGDGSLVNIHGKGTVLFVCRTGEHCQLDGVYYIPRLTTNIISLSQMDETGFKVDIESGILRLFDPDRQLLAMISGRLVEAGRSRTDQAINRD